jgi:hypothetical protein
MHLDIDHVSAVFQRLDEESGSNPDSRRMREAAITLHFVWSSGHVHNFEDLLACFNLSALSEQIVSFDTREQAQTWLKQSQDPATRLIEEMLSSSAYPVGLN